MTKSAKWTSSLLATLILSILFSAPPAFAASIRYDPTVKAALDKLPQPAKAVTLYNEAIALQKQQDGLDEQIVKLRETNEQALLLVEKQIKLIDAVKLSGLQAEVKQAKEKYQPLFDEYRAVNQQISAAKYIPSKELKAVLRLKADAMKPAVSMARLDIKNKEAALKSAKEATSKTVKKIKDILEDIDSVRVKIRAEKAAAAIPAKHLASAWSSFRTALKKGSAKDTAETLADVNALLRQTNARKQSIRELEARIGAIIGKAKSFIPNPAS